jgi:arylsulfatase A-like enzyme
LTRREFLKVAGAGAAGMTLLAAAGCDRTQRLPNRPDKAPTGGSDMTDMNVILVILDTMRKDHVGAYGNEWIKTPNLDALAKESLLFTRAYPESMPTLCARRAIHTGMRTWPFRDYEPAKGESLFIYGWQPIPDEQTTLAEILRSKGYDAMFVTDTYHQFEPSYNFHRGFDAYYFIRGQTTDHFRPLWMCPQEKLDQSLLKGGSPVAAKLRRYFANNYAKGAERKSEEDWFAPQVFMRSAEFLDGASQEQPFFLCVDCYDPHEPWDPPEEYVSLYDEGYDGPEPYAPSYGSSDYLTERELKRMRALYAGEVTMMDRWLGNFLERVDSMGLMENTLLILLGDHGHCLGEHGYVGKPENALYPELVEVPFLVRHPEAKGAGQTSDHYASTHDVAPTILGALGIEPREPMEGQDLSVLLEGGEPEARPHFTLGFEYYVWTRDDSYVMFGRNDGTEAKLFDLREDLEMRNDIARQHPDMVQSMFQDYVLKDAGGGPLPNYQKPRSKRRAAT